MVETITIFVLAIFRRLLRRVGRYASTTYTAYGSNQCVVIDHRGGRNDSNGGDSCNWC